MKAEKRFMKTSLLNICYEESGRPDGVPVILLHGLPPYLGLNIRNY